MNRKRIDTVWMAAAILAGASLLLLHGIQVWNSASSLTEVEWLLTLVDWSVSGLLLCLGLVVIRNERKSRSQLQDALRRFQSILDSVGEASIWALDARGCVVAINHSAAARLNVRPDDMTGKLLTEFLPPDVAGKAAEVHRTVMTSRVAHREETEVRLGEGRDYWFESIAAPWLDESGRVIGVIGHSLDITLRKRADAEAAEAKDQLQQSMLKLEQLNSRIGLLGEMIDALHACSSLDESYEVLRKYSVRLLNRVSGTVYLLRASRNLLEPVVSFGHSEVDADMIQPEDCWALRKGHMHVVTDPQRDLVCPHIHSSADSQGASLCVPLVAQGDLMGLLTLCPAPGTGLDPDETALAKSMAEQIAMSLTGLRLQEQLRQQSIVDALTGLYNRRFLDETLLRELARAERKSVPLSLLMLDVDHFKLWNDKHGHEAGDQVLRLIGAELRNLVRGSDIACRFGGEEFCILMPEATADQAIERAGQIRERIGQLQVVDGGRQLGQVTISGGVATWPLHAADAQALVRAADGALYEAKGAGRNRIHMAKGSAEPRI